MDPRDAAPAAVIEFPGSTAHAHGRQRIVWHALALLLAAVVTWLVFSAYRQPDFILDLAAFRLC